MIASPPFLPLPTALVAAGVFAFFGLQLTSSAAFTAPVQHFPQFRGAAASLVKSFVGLGGAVTTQTFVLIWGTPTADVTALNALLLWAGFGLAVNVLAAILMPSKASPDEHEEPKAVLDVLFFALTVLGCFATVVGIVPNDSMVHTVLVYGLLILALAPVLIIFGPIGVSGESNGHSMPSPVAVKASLQRQKSSFESPVAYDLGQMLCRSETWLLWFCGAVILGSGNVLATNMAQIIESMGAENKLLPTAVTLFSTGNLLGRLLCTIPSDAIVKRGWPRPLFVGGIAALAAASHLSLLCAALVGGEPERVFGLSLPFMRKKPIDESVLPTSMLQASLLQGGALGGGLAFGAMWPHFVVLASELFGSAHLATNYMFFDGSCGAAGTDAPRECAAGIRLRESGGRRGRLRWADALWADARRHCGVVRLRGDRVGDDRMQKCRAVQVDRGGEEARGDEGEGHGAALTAWPRTLMMEVVCDVDVKFFVRVKYCYGASIVLSVSDFGRERERSVRACEGES